MIAKRITVAVACVLPLLAASQDFRNHQPTIVYSQPELTSIDRGHLGGVVLQFRIPGGYHINSNQPKEDYLKKTELKLDPPTDIAIAGVTYPPGEYLTNSGRRMPTP